MSSKSFVGFFSLLAALVFFVAATAEAATYYVDKTHAQASDSNSGTEALPWKTIRHAADVVRAGDTVYVKGNGATYVESWTGDAWNVPTLRPQNSGSPGNPITFRAYPGHTVTLTNNSSRPVIGSATQRNYIIWEGFHVLHTTTTGGIAAALTNTVGSELGYLTIVSTAGAINNASTIYAGIVIHEGENVRVHHSDISGFHGNSDNQTAIIIWQYGTEGAVIEDNYLHDNATGIYDKAGGVNTTTRRNFLVRNSNLDLAGNSPGQITATFFIYDNVWESGASLHTKNVGSEVHDNLVLTSRLSGSGSTQVDTLTGVKIWNNVIKHATPRAWRQEWARTGNEFDYVDYNFYTGTPYYEFVSTNQNIAFMQSIGYELNSGTGVTFGDIYDPAWNLKTAYKTAGRHGDAVGPGNGSDGLVAQIMNPNRYGPGALGGGNTTAPGAPKNLKITP